MACTITRILDAPGVESVSAGSRTPSEAANWSFGFVPEQTALASERGVFPANGVVVAPGYFETLGIRRIQGRTFTDRDGLAGTPGVVVVNRRLAERHWGAKEPIGRRLKLWAGPGERSEWLTVVGVVDDVLNASSRLEFAVYFPHAQQPAREMALCVRTTSDSMAVGTAGALRSLLAGVAPTDPVALGGVTLVMLTAACVACYLPARRAGRIDPVRVLRQD